MGLDFSHGDAHWSYSGFHNFRTALAASIGINLELMEGFGGELSWSTVKDDIVPLLDHSDCDGWLPVNLCRPVAKRLREIVSLWGDDHYHKIRALLLAEGMELAAKKRQKFEFC